MAKTATKKKKGYTPESDGPEEMDLRVDVPNFGLQVHRGYAISHVDVRLTRRQAAAAKMLAGNLSNQGKRSEGSRRSVVAGGSTVETAGDAIRWLLDQIANQVEESGVSLERDFHLEF